MNINLAYLPITDLLCVWRRNNITGQFKRVRIIRMQSYGLDDTAWIERVTSVGVMINYIGTSKEVT